MEDSEILARLKHERELREQLAEEVKQMRTMDRWRWAVGIAVGVLVATFPGALGEVMVTLFGKL